MRVPLAWLAEFVDVGDVSPTALAERLADAGLPVESFEAADEDTVLDIEVTPNRPDCMSVAGVAREVALLLARPLRLPEGYGRRLRAGPGSELPLAVEVETPEGCPRFTATLVRSVRVGPSPQWMQRRLELCGVRAINTIVDVTNYVMLEIGQPMHAFDYDRVAGRRLTVRRARPGETLQTLDGVTRRLEDDMVVIADAEGPVSLAGIMGGSSTEIRSTTSTVVLEAATWDPPTIGRTARRLGLRTEASARFERGTDPEGPVWAQARAARLLAQLRCGRAVRGMVDVSSGATAPRVVRLRPGRASAVLGVELAPAEMARILRFLGCGVRGARTLIVQVPGFRPDLTREEDLIEEVARVYGYERIPQTLPRGETTPGRLHPALALDRRVREVLTRCGLTEVLTLTLVSREAAAVGAGPPIALENPLAADQGALRTSLLPGMVEVLATNASRRVSDVHIFELGRVFRRRDTQARPEERRAVAIAVMGRWRSGWNIPEGQAVADFFHLRGILDRLLSHLGVPLAQVRPHEAPPPGSEDGEVGPPWWHPDRAAELVCQGEVVGRFGELHPERASGLRLPHRAYVAELDLEVLYGMASPVGTYRGLPRYPDVERDLAVVVPETRPAAEVEALIREAAGPLLEAVELFDVYSGPSVPSGHRSLAYRLRLRAPDRTLTAAEAEEIMVRVRNVLREAGGRLRE